MKHHETVTNQVPVGPTNPYAVPGMEHGVPPRASLGEKVGNAAMAGLIVVNNMVGVEPRTTERQVTDTVEVAGTQRQIQVTEIPGEPHEVTVELPGGVINRLSPTFETTAEDKEATGQQVGDLIERALPRNRWQYIIGAKVQGESSAEDENTGGLQKSSKPNQYLSEQRGDIATDALRDVMGDTVKALEDRGALEVGGTEHSWPDEAVAEARDWAAQLGYANEDELVKAYDNDPSSFSPEAVEFLKPLLDDHRGAKISFELLMPGETETQTVEVWVPITTLQQHTRTEKVTQVTTTRKFAEVANTGVFTGTGRQASWQSKPSRFKVNQSKVSTLDRNPRIQQSRSGNYELGNMSRKGGKRVQGHKNGFRTVHMTRKGRGKVGR